MQELFSHNNAIFDAVLFQSSLYNPASLAVAKWGCIYTCRLEAPNQVLSPTAFWAPTPVVDLDATARMFCKVGTSPTIPSQEGDWEGLDMYRGLCCEGKSGNLLVGVGLDVARPRSNVS